MAAAHQELTGKTGYLPRPSPMEGQPGDERFQTRRPASREDFGCARQERPTDRALSAEEFRLPGYALCSPSAQTPPPELKRGKRPQSDRSGPNYAKII
jgi:hypothetical protein